jgi:hypothetical protein
MTSTRFGGFDRFGGFNKFVRRRDGVWILNLTNSSNVSNPRAAAKHRQAA